MVALRQIPSGATPQPYGATPDGGYGATPDPSGSTPDDQPVASRLPCGYRAVELLLTAFPAHAFLKRIVDIFNLSFCNVINFYTLSIGQPYFTRFESTGHHLPKLLD